MEVVMAAKCLVGERCREDLGPDHDYERCNAPAEFVLWGKLIAPEGLGPRCYDHAAKHVGHRALAPESGWAIMDLRPLQRALSGLDDGVSVAANRGDVPCS